MWSLIVSSFLALGITKRKRVKKKISVGGFLRKTDQ